MISDLIKGVGTALITPFQSNGAIDTEALERIVELQLQANIDFLVVLGTTGETATMTAGEQQNIRRTIVFKNHGQVPLVLGMGGNCTKELVERINLLSEELKRNYAAILTVCPYYNKPNQEGLYRHFAAVAEISPIPVILYNVPGRTGVNMLPETVVRLAANFPHKIAGIKEASGNRAQIQEIIERTKGSEFFVLSGDDGLAAPLMHDGAHGLISVLSNALPKQTMKLVHDKDLNMQEKLNPLIDLLFKEGNPTGIKALMALQGTITNRLRLPLVEASNELNAAIKTTLNNLAL